MGWSHGQADIGGLMEQAVSPFSLLSDRQRAPWSRAAPPLFDLISQDSYASYDVNGNDYDPSPRYDASNENKYVLVALYHSGPAAKATGS